MPFDSENNENLEHTIRAMSHDLGVIKQKLATTEPVNPEIDKKLNTLGHFLKSSLDNMNQQINHTQNNFQVLANMIKQTEDNLRKEIRELNKKAMEESRKNIEDNFAKNQEEIRKILSQNNEAIRDDMTKQNYAALQMKKETDALRKEFQDTIKSMEAKNNVRSEDITEIKNKIGDKFDETFKILWRLLEINYKLLKEKKADARTIE